VARKLTTSNTYMDAKKIVNKKIALKVPQSKQNWNLVNKSREKTNIYITHEVTNSKFNHIFWIIGFIGTITK
jgi:hypothetical protein